MNFIWRTSRAAAFLVAALASAQQERDLKIERDAPAGLAPASVSIPRSYAVVIGVGKYRRLAAAQQLQYAERDAEAVCSILISPEGGNFRAENVHRLIGERATLSNLRRELEQWLPSAARPDDRVLVYFAGHGFVHEGRGYLAPYDIDVKDIPGTGFAMDALGEIFGSRIQAKWKVLLTDSCHSGAITPAETEQLNKTLAGLQPSVFSLTASRARERSFESPDWGGGHGLFTYYAVKGLEGAADESGDGIVTADELAEYVRREVRAATKGQQNPTSDRGSFDPNMLLSYVPSTARPGAPPPPKSGTLVIEANMDGVEVFVDGKAAGVVEKAKPLRLPGLAPGVHTIKGVRMGYEPDGPREEMVYPGQEATVTLRILIRRQRNKAAVEAFEKGIELYQRGQPQNYKRALEQFSQALDADATFSRAALYMGRAYGALYEPEQAQKCLRRAIGIDPDYLEARTSLAGMLLDSGAVDEAIRQLNYAARRDPSSAFTYTLLSQAYRMKELYPEAADAARKAIGLAPATAEPHLWLADSLRLHGSTLKDRQARDRELRESVSEYDRYLRLSDFDSKLAGQLNYYVLGYLLGRGKKKRPAQADIWRDMRSLAWFGICDSQKLLGRYDAAIESCTKALRYDPKDPYVHYALGLSFAYRYNQTDRVENLPAALTHFRAALDLNPDLVEAANARRNISAIEATLRKVN